MPTGLGRFLKLFTQEFRGNVTIFPVPINLIEFSKLISNPTKESIEKCKVYGGRKTYPKICKIENLVKIENAIEKYYRRINKKVSNKISEKAYNIYQDESSLDDRINSESEDFEDINQKHNKFIIYPSKKPNHLIKLNSSNTIINEERSNYNTIYLRRDKSFNTPRNFTNI